MSGPAPDERLLDLLYGELDAEAAAALEAEIKTDPVLRERLEAWRVVRRAMADLPEPEPDPQVHYEILRAARQAVEKPEKKGIFAWLAALSFNPAFAVLGVAVLGGALWVALSQGYRDSDALAPESPLEKAAQPAEPGRAEPTRAARAEEAPPTPTVGAEADGQDAWKAEPGSKADKADPRGGGPSDGEAGLGRAEAKQTVHTIAPATEAAAAAEPAVPVGDANDADELLGGDTAPRADAAESRRRTVDRGPARKGAAKNAADELIEDAGGGGRAFSPPPPVQAAPKAREQRAEPAVEAPLKTLADAPAEEAAKKESKDLARGPAPFPAEAPQVADDSVAGAAPDARPMQAPGAPPADVATGGPIERERAEDKAIEAVAEEPADVPEVAVPEAAVAEAAVAEAEESEAEGTAFRDGMLGELAPPAQGNAAPPQAARKKMAAAKPAAVAEANEESAPPPPELLAARSARQRGDHEAAVEAYQRYLEGYASDDQFAAAMLEAAQSYEALGETGRALQLYRLAARSGDARVAAQARQRITAIESLSKAKAAQPEPPARPAPGADLEQAAPAEPASEPALPE